MTDDIMSKLNMKGQRNKIGLESSGIQKVMKGTTI